jgi:hypothetical protein
MKPALVFLTGVCLSGAAGATYLALHQGSPHGDGSSSAEVTALRGDIDELAKKVSTLQTKLDSMHVATAAPVEPASRQPTASQAPKAVDDSPAPHIASTDRDLIFALIKEERDLRDKERQDKQREQQRDNLERSVKRTAERMGFDSNTVASLSKLYLDNFSREEDIRRAYPVTGFEDPNNEKRRLELEASRKQLDSSLEGVIPADKIKDWNKQGRFLRRGADFGPVGMGDMGGVQFTGGGGSFQISPSTDNGDMKLKIEKLLNDSSSIGTPAPPPKPKQE